MILACFACRFVYWNIVSLHSIYCVIPDKYITIFMTSKWYNGVSKLKPWTIWLSWLQFCKRLQKRWLPSPHNVLRYCDITVLLILWDECNFIMLYFLYLTGLTYQSVFGSWGVSVFCSLVNSLRQIYLIGWFCPVVLVIFSLTLGRQLQIIIVFFVDPFAGDAFYSMPASCQTHILKSYTTGNARSRYEIFNIAYVKKEFLIELNTLRFYLKN